MTRDFTILSFFVYFALFLLVEFVFTRYRRGDSAKGNKDPLTFLLFGILPSMGMFAWMFSVNHGLVPAHPTWAIWILGWVVGLTGFAIRIVAKRTLGRFFTVRVQLQEDHQVVDTGIYGLLRHPLYLGVILEWMAPPLILGSPAGFLFTSLDRHRRAAAHSPRGGADGGRAG